MKFDKETLVMAAVCVIILLVGKPIARMTGLLPPDKEPDTSIAVLAAQQPLNGPVRTLGNEKMTISILPQEGKIARITFPEYLDSLQENAIVLDQTLTNVGALSVFDRTGLWELVRVEEDILDTENNNYLLTRQMRNAAGQEFRVTQVWSISGDFRVGCAITIENLNNQSLLFPALVVNGGDIPPWPMLSGDKVHVPSHRMDIMTTAGKTYDIKADTKKDAKFFIDPLPTVKWVGMSNKFFSTVLTSNEPFVLYQNRFRYRGPNQDHMILEGGALYPGFHLAANQSRTLEFTAYYGPKIIQELERLEPGTVKMMHLAWGPLNYVARPLLWVLVAIHGFCNSYGVAIIILTLIVRTLFYPVTAKANASMRKMQQVKPQLDKLREEYKDNPQMFNTKMWELYRQEKINPVGGCFPILLQLPVFFALYATLNGAIQLRQEPFLWAKDLAAADTILTIPMYFFELPVNPFVLMMSGLMVVQQHLTPMSMEPMQKKMMMMMPIIMLLFLYDLPSGLTLYWTVSNLFSIIQLRLQQRHMPPPVIPKVGA